jgi:hypothetical protein
MLLGVLFAGLYTGCTSGDSVSDTDPLIVVTDPSTEAPVKDVLVVLNDKDGGIISSGKTDIRGQYPLPMLLPDDSSLTIASYDRSGNKILQTIYGLKRQAYRLRSADQTSKPYGTIRVTLAGGVPTDKSVTLAVLGSGNCDTGLPEVFIPILGDTIDFPVPQGCLRDGEKVTVLAVRKGVTALNSWGALDYDFVSGVSVKPQGQVDVTIGTSWKPYQLFSLKFTKPATIDAARTNGGIDAGPAIYGGAGSVSVIASGNSEQAITATLGFPKDLAATLGDLDFSTAFYGSIIKPGSPYFQYGLIQKMRSPQDVTDRTFKLEELLPDSGPIDVRMNSGDGTVRRRSLSWTFPASFGSNAMVAFSIWNDPQASHEWLLTAPQDAGKIYIPQLPPSMAEFLPEGSEHTATTLYLVRESWMDGYDGYAQHDSSFFLFDLIGRGTAHFDEAPDDNAQFAFTSVVAENEVLRTTAAEAAGRWNKLFKRARSRNRAR